MYQRHQLVYLKEKAFFEIATCSLTLQAIKPYISAWIDKGLPCIYPRQLSTGYSVVNLGLPVLYQAIKHNIKLEVHKNLIHKVTPLLKLREINYFFKQILSIPHAEQIFVYGSYLFQHLSQLAFVHADSDLDILIEYPSISLLEIAKIIELLQLQSGLRIDGEVRFENKGDIAIRELLDFSAKDLLVKTSNKVYLLAREKLYVDYPTLCP